MVDSETNVRVDRDTLLRSILDAEREGHTHDSLNLVRGNVKVSIKHRGSIDFDLPGIQRRLDSVGALDQARAEGFMAGLLVGTTVAIEDQIFGDIMDDL